MSQFRVIDVSRKVTLKKRRTSVVTDQNANATIDDRITSLETRVKEILPLLGVREIEFINIPVFGSHPIELTHGFNGRVSWYVSDATPGDVAHIGVSPQVSRDVDGLTLVSRSNANVLALYVNYVGTISITIRSVQ